MQIEKWFKVLVLGGAAMTMVSCSEMKPNTSTGGNQPPADGGEKSDGPLVHGSMDANAAADAAMQASDTGPSADAGFSRDFM